MSSNNLSALLRKAQNSIIYEDLKPGSGISIVRADGKIVFSCTVTGGTDGGISSVDKYSELPAENSTDCLYFVKSTETIDEVTYKSGIYFYSVSTKAYTYADLGSASSLTLKVNGIALVPDENGAFNFSVPEKVSELQNDTGFITRNDTATTDKAGVIKIDGKTITIKDGVASTNAGGAFDDTSVNTDKGYTSSKIESDFARKGDVLTLTNTTIYTPAGDYQPATKKYVDDALNGIHSMNIKKDILSSETLLPADAQEGDTYCVGEEGAESYDMYIRLADGNWLRIGNTGVNFSNYYTIEDVNDLLNAKIEICESLPTPDIDYAGQVYLNITDMSFNICKDDGSGVYSWETKSINTGTSNNGAKVYIGNVMPDDTETIWLDTSDSSATLLKVYNKTTSIWETLNNIPKSVADAYCSNNKLMVVFSDGTSKNLDLSQNGSYIQASLINGNILNNGMEQVVYNDKDVMKKNEYAHKDKAGYVNNAETALSLEMFKDLCPNYYVGSNPYNQVGVFPFPISIKDLQNSQLKLVNAKKDYLYTIALLQSDANCTSIVQAFEFIQSEAESTDIANGMYIFNNEDDYICDHENVDIDNYCDIKKEHIIRPTIYEGKYYEFKINKSVFLSISGLKVEVSE